jgi:isovaleryl-CoA dehydrogenase
MSGLDFERAVIAMLNRGMAERALDLALDYARTREQFGRRIGDFQLIQGKLAEMYVGLETMRSLCYRTCADCFGCGSDFGGSGYMRETEINRLYRASKLLEIGAGTVEIRKLIIGGELLS